MRGRRSSRAHSAAAAAAAEEENIHIAYIGHTAIYSCACVLVLEMRQVSTPGATPGNKLAPACRWGREKKTPTRILEEPAQPSFLPSVNSYRLFLLQVHGRAHFFEFLCVTRNCDSGYDE